MSKVEYLQKMADVLNKLPRSDFYFEIELAQAALESDFGKSKLATEANNHFGHKYSDYTGDHYVKDALETVDGKLVVDKDTWWRKYKTVYDCALDHSSWLTRAPKYEKIYAKAIKAKNWREQAKELMGTYATDTPTSYSIGYEKKLINIIETYELWNYNKRDKKEELTMSWTPNIVDRRKVSMGHNKYNGRSLKQITKAARHHTAGGLYQTMAIIEDWWRNGNKWDNGGYHVVIDGHGTVFINYDWDHITWGVGYHNDYTVHVSLMGNGSFTAAQEKSYDWVMQKIFKELPQIKPSDVLGHNEFSGHTTNSCPGINMNTVRARLAKLKDTPTVDPRFVDFPDYTSPTLPFKAMKEGDKVTIRPGQTAWYDPKTSEGLKPSKDFTGDKDTITRVMDVNVGYSKKAYLLKGKVSWILEQDLEEPRVDWKPVEEVKPDEQDVGRKDNQFLVEGILYEVNKVK